MLIRIGNLYWTAASSHLYKRNYDAAISIINNINDLNINDKPIPIMTCKKDMVIFTDKLNSLRNKNININKFLEIL